MARLVIDNREHKLIEQLKIPFETSSLDIGDVVIGDAVTLERKTIADLEASVHDGRYREQKARAKANQIRMMYVIEGDFVFSDANPARKTLTGCVINTMIRDGIGVFFTKDVKETATLIECIHQRIQADPAKYAATAAAAATTAATDYISTISLKKKENIDVATCFMLQLACIPGISSKKAKSIIEHHKDIHCMKDFCEKIKNVKPETFFKTTPGIGKTLAETIYSFCAGT